MYDFVGRQGGDVEPKQQIYDLKIRNKFCLITISQPKNSKENIVTILSYSRVKLYHRIL
jgi:hypothetical protein